MEEVTEEDISDLKQILQDFRIKNVTIPEFKTFRELERFKKEKIKNHLNNYRRSV